MENTDLNTKLTDSDKSFLKDLARKAIKARLNLSELDIEEAALPETLKKEGTTFVTITTDGQLRGCIGKTTATQPLYKDVIENALSTAFNDPRFVPLTKPELPRTEIEVSVLGKPKPLKYSTPAKLLDFLEKNKPGVLIKKGGHRATFLPQVWDEVADATEFLTHLCLKAGLGPLEWQSGMLLVEYYFVEKF